jgi:hypothetical protein
MTIIFCRRLGLVSFTECNSSPIPNGQFVTYVTIAFIERYKHFSSVYTFRTLTNVLPDSVPLAYVRRYVIVPHTVHPAKQVEPGRNVMALRKRPILVSPLGIFRRRY